MDEYKKELTELLGITKTLRKMTDNSIKSAMKLNCHKSTPYNVNQDRHTKSNTNELSNKGILVQHDNDSIAGRGIKRGIASVDETTENAPKRVKRPVSKCFKSHFRLARNTPKRRKTFLKYNTLKYYTPSLPAISEETIM